MFRVSQISCSVVEVSETIFARTLFSGIALKDIFATVTLKIWAFHQGLHCLLK